MLAVELNRVGLQPSIAARYWDKQAPLSHMSAWIQESLTLLPWARFDVALFPYLSPLLGDPRPYEGDCQRRNGSDCFKQENEG